jgi:hypothetical protein
MFRVSALIQKFRQTREDWAQAERELRAEGNLLQGGTLKIQISP